MDILKKGDLWKLIEKPEFPSVSLYMPTQQSGSGARQNQIRFKNLFNEARNMLRKMGMDSQGELLDPAGHLIQDDLFWTSQGKGFALFCSPELYLTFRLPIPFKELVVVTNCFHINPILPLLEGDGRFYVLALSQGGVRVLRCTRQDCKEVTPEDMPKGIAETLRYDDPQKQLQFHTGAKGGKGKRPAMFHGQGAGFDDEKENLIRYCSDIGRSLHSLFSQDGAPVILAGVEPLVSLYRQASSGLNLLDQGIDHNPDELTNEMLHQRGWELAEGYFQSAQQQSLTHYMEMAGTGMTSSDIKEIVSESRYGRVENLFVNTDTRQWGVFEEATGTLEFHERQEPGDQDLLNAASLNTLNKGGTVHALNSDSMPDGNPLCAVFRY